MKPLPETSLALGPDCDGAVLLIRADRVLRFARGAGPGSSPADAVRCPGARIAPGRVNAHTHLYSGLVPLGMPPLRPEPERFLDILKRLWWRLDRTLDERSLRAAARYYVADALLAGTTALVDHHESPAFVEGSLEVLADACQELGMRAVLCYGATERNGGRDEARRGLEENRRFILENRRPLVRGVVGLHASFTVSDGTIREAARLCRELGTVMHVHLAEDLADVEDARRRGYPGPLERLLELSALPRGSILAHGVHLDADQVRLAADRGCWLVQNPRSNRGNRVGYPRALAESSRVALGTDGYPARMDDEAAVLMEEAAARGDDMAAAGARAQAGHELIAERFGLAAPPLGPGAAADAAATFEERILHLVVGGRLVVRDGRLSTGDSDEIRHTAEAQAQRLWRRMAELP